MGRQSISGYCPALPATKVSPQHFSIVPLVVHQYSLKFLGEERRFFLRTQNNNTADLNSQRLEPKKTLAVRVISCL